MRRAVLALVAALTLSAVAPQAMAQTPTDRADVRCLLALTVAGRDPRNKEAAAAGTQYFMGRLDGRAIGAKLEPTMLAESKALNSGPAIQAELTRCAAQLNKRGAEMKATFQRLQAQAGPPPGAAPATPPAK